MENFDIKEWLTALTYEIRNHKIKMVLCFAVLTLTVVAVGSVWPIKFQSSGTIYADQQNIIQPLLKGSAEVTGLDEKRDHKQVVEERLGTKTVIKQIVDEVNQQAPHLKLSESQVRSGISVKNQSKTHVKISFTDKNREKAFLVTSVAMSMFVQDTSRVKREESKQAFTFIDAQVRSYKDQLQKAEDNLKIFKSENIDGSEGSVSNRRTQLQSTLQQNKQDLLESQTKRDELLNQLNRESQFLTRRSKTEALNERLRTAQSQLDTLRLTYQENHPDIIELKYQISDLQKMIFDTRNASVDADPSTSAENPIYQELRSRLTDAELEIRTIELRIKSNEKLIAETYSSSKRIAESQAQLAELTRDYNVTKELYEDMLERKEKARLSMTLDIEGQGVSYKIFEPPVFPETPVGLRFIHFYLIAPLTGLLIPFGLLVAYIQFDPRVRFSYFVKNTLPDNIPLLATINHIETKTDLRIRRKQWITLSVFISCLIAIYISLGFLRISGII